MKIGLCAIDSKMVNLAILKIGQHHINKGDTVKWYDPLFDQDLDKLYISKIFTFSEDLLYHPNCEIIRGGTGYNIASKLDDEIENITDVKQAYLLLYPNCDYSIQFTTRGCVRYCSFCLVRQKEGLTHDVKTLSLNPNGKYIELLDNNFFSSNTWRNRLEVIKSYNQPITFNTGLDVRTITEEQCKALGECKIKVIHCAWDNLEDEQQVLNGLKMLSKYVKPYKITVYVLVGYKHKNIIDDDIYRAMTLHNLGVNPYACGFMDYENKNKKTQSVRAFCRWVNHKATFKTVKWEEYK